MAPLLAALLALPGCDALVTEGSAELSGLGSAGLASAITRDTAITAGIGVATLSATRAGLDYARRRLQAAEQDSIATAAGPLGAGQVAEWSVSHTLPLAADRAGRVAISREIGALGLACREIVFSVAAEKKEETEFFTAIICRQGEHWKWASAEPATARWGSLQ
ncbi:hypothetical protein NON00_16315 [Roseomonas sp. GC11]|uniref:hypothetical protein n=1 Tax=Roseomonas sp. GC11 TaxID=2950546 RepID=UPI00210CF94E|nr:hypothetical protein [Roseomonas sp. GC11]MCQ4161485.1 hypothetical protein [Roseomonas sp. GC11]